MIAAVTAFVSIPDHPRSSEDYHKLAAPLLALATDQAWLITQDELKNCWLYRYLHEVYGNPPRVTHSVSDDPRKNTLAYHIVQAQKSEFLLEAAQASNMMYDTYVWIDYGIFHLPGITTEIIKDFLQRAANESTITIPGCWGPSYQYDDRHPCWRFCGGVMVVPRKYLGLFNSAMKQEYIDWIRRCKNVSWEVNTLARVEHNSDLPIWWYQADHDATMFTNYQATEFAEGRQPASHFSGAV